MLHIKEFVQRIRGRKNVYKLFNFSIVAHHDCQSQFKKFSEEKYILTLVAMDFRFDIY